MSDIVEGIRGGVCVDEAVMMWLGRQTLMMKLEVEWNRIVTSSHLGLCDMRTV